MSIKSIPNIEIQGNRLGVDSGEEWLPQVR